jgi:hypothetical protein
MGLTDDITTACWRIEAIRNSLKPRPLGHDPVPWESWHPDCDHVTARETPRLGATWAQEAQREIKGTIDRRT